MIRYITYIIALIFATSCSKESSPSIEQEEVRNIAFNMKTKGDGELSDYCFSLYTNSQNTAPQYGFYTSKIYEKEQYQWLEPMEESGNLGLAAAVGTYTMLVVSPAVKPSSALGYFWIDMNTSTLMTETKKIFGYTFYRVPDEENETENKNENDQLYIGDPANIYIEGVLASTSPDETTYNYKFDEGYTLKQQRSKLQLTVRTQSDENDSSNKLSYKVDAIYIYNVVNKALFNPTVGYYPLNWTQNLEAFVDFKDDEVDTIIDNTEAKVLEVEPDENIDNDNYFYLLSADYSNREKWYPITPPSLKVQFRNSSGSYRTVPIMLDVDFRPQHLYTFDLTFSSTEITLSITVKEGWDKQEDVTDDVIGLDKSTIIVSIEDDNNWENGGAINGDIDYMIDNK